MKHWDQQKRKRAVALTCLGAAVLMMVAIFWFVGRPLIAFVSQPERFRAWVDSHGVLGRLAFVGMMMFQVFIAIIPGEALEIGAGYAFGAIEGTLLCLLATTLSSVVIFLIVKRYGMKFVTLFVSEEKLHSLKFLRDTRRLELLTFLLFFIPGTPKDWLVYLGPFLPVPARNFFLISTLARIPSVLSSTFAAASFAAGSWRVAAVVYLCTGLAAAVCVWKEEAILRWISRRKGRGTNRGE